MKKVLIAIILAASAAPAWAQEGKVNFGGAAIPVPVLERVSIPERRVDMSKLSEEELGSLLLKAARRNSQTPGVYCYAGEPMVMGNKVCGSECCAMDPKGDGQYELLGCFPKEPCFDAVEPEEKTLARAKVRFAEMQKARADEKGTEKKNRGKYEDCCNDCNWGYIDCLEKNPLDTGGACIKGQKCCITLCGGGVCGD